MMASTAHGNLSGSLIGDEGFGRQKFPDELSPENSLNTIPFGQVEVESAFILCSGFIPTLKETKESVLTSLPFATSLVTRISSVFKSFFTSAVTCSTETSGAIRERYR